MKKISIIIIFLLGLLLFASCNIKTYKTYEEDMAKEFIDEIYEYIDNGKANYCLIDVRDLNTSYANGHFKGFINYDIKNGTIDEFLYKIESMYSKDKTIFIIDEDGSNIEELMNKLKDKGYKKIHGYLGGYNRLEEENNNDFEVVTGTDDCGC